MKETKTTKTHLVERLNELLAAYQVVYFNTRASHWMIKGENFFELHKVFEQQYEDATQKIDALAERILTLGGVPLMTASEMLKSTHVTEAKLNGDQAACIQRLLEDLTALTVLENDLVKMADAAEDVVTADLLTGYLGEQQKTTWMLYQFLKKKSTVK